MEIQNSHGVYNLVRHTDIIGLLSGGTAVKNLGLLIRKTWV